MQIKHLEVNNIRNFEKLSLSPSPGFNFIFGNNGSGKTSILEMISMITTTRSFRTSRLSNIQKRGSDQFFLFSRIESEGIDHKVGYQKQNKIRRIKLNQTFITRSSELALLFPIIIFTPESLYLLTEGSKVRRSFLDRLLFHVKHDYSFHYKSYQRALRQRNGQLKSANTKLVSQWDGVLAKHGEWIAEQRKLVFTELNIVFNKVVERLNIIQFDSISFKINTGWDKELTLQDALHSSYEKDIHLGFTSVGIHRSDFQLYANNRSIKDIFSRGEMKLLSFVLHLSQLIYLGRILKSGSILLIDDLFAEIDKTNIEKLMKTLRHFKSQTFITSTDEVLLTNYHQEGDKVFHVEHGMVKEVL